MIRRISLGVVAAISVIGGAAGVYGFNGASGQAQSGSNNAAADVSCSLTWNTGTPDPLRNAGAVQRSDLKKLAIPEQQEMQVQAGVNGVIKGYIQAPLQIMPAKKTCTGGNPIEVTWKGYRGSTYIGDLWFLNQSNQDLRVYDADPLGLRTWVGTPEPDADQVVTHIDPPAVDSRTMSRIWVPITEPQANGYYRIVSEVVRYYITPNTFGLYGNIGVMVQMRCSSTAPWTNLTKKVSDPSAARFEISVKDDERCPAPGYQLELQGVIDDAQYTWGGPAFIARFR